MPIKQLQLRGISRTPSDRSVADGGCAESLNVHLDQQETAPTLPPVDYSDTAYGASVTASSRYPIVFIHKMPNGTTNYIGYRRETGATPLVEIYSYGPGGTVRILRANGSSAAFKSATSIGNMLIIYTDTTGYYFVYDGVSSYKSLGSEVSVPQIEIAALPQDPRYVSAEVLDETLKTTMDSPWDVWNGASVGTSELHGGLLSAMAGLWDAVSVGIQEIRSEGMFAAPFFIRYALKMYDGGYIHSSAPVLCGGFEARIGFSVDWLTASLTTEGTGSEQVNKLAATFNNPFKVYIRCGSTSVWDNLTSIVESIDFFASTPIYAPAIGAGYGTMYSDRSIKLDTMDDASRESTIREEVLSKGQFYKILSIPINDPNLMGQLADGTFVLTNSDTVSGDLLLVQETMPETYRDSSQYFPLVGAKNFNNRELLIGAVERLPRGNFHLNGQAGGHGGTSSWSSSMPSMSDYYLRFKIEDSTTGEVYYVGMRSGNAAVQNACFCLSGGVVSLEPGSNVPSSSRYNKCTPYAWIAYPDTRCTEVELRRPGPSSSFIVAMKPHPLLECSYAFLGFGVSYNEVSGSSTSYDTAENRTMPADNKVFLSEFENPYIFPAGNIVTFPDRVVDLAATSVPLSEGQYGEHTMYAFTEGGIRVLGVNAEGTFSAQAVHPNLGRYVALPGTILSIEQAVIFATKKGVMMLSGGNVTDLSANMNGTPFRMTGETGSDMAAIYTTLSRVTSDWRFVVPATVSDKTFMWFMREAKPAYDYNAARIIFFKDGTTWQYVYHLATQTWHKMYHPESHVLNPTVLNSFPDCLISFKDNNDPLNPVGKVLNYSTALDDEALLSSSANAVRGVIMTRPFDLGEPDIRKAIRSIRIRGNYNRADVQYLLLGSFDNINWRWLKSLRGGSYKTFRLILLTNLAPMERITWIDVDYESRLTNKLR